MFVLLYTAGQTIFGWQSYRDLGSMARFGTLIFQVLAIVQLTLFLAAGLLFAAGNVAQEKDRRTLILLLMTDLRNHELVLGKMLSSLLQVGVLLATSIPVFFLVQMFGGITFDQILWTIALCAATALLAGSWGTLVAFWRDKTFQTLAISLFGPIILIGLAEAIANSMGPNSQIGYFAGLFNPYRSLAAIINPFLVAEGTEVIKVTAWPSVVALSGLSLLLTVITIARLRVWNPSRLIYITNSADAEEEVTEKGTEKVVEAKVETRDHHRKVWSKPIIWREMKTRAYGRKMILIKLAYLAIAACVGLWVWSTIGVEDQMMGMISAPGLGFVILGLISLLLVNSQAVTSITGERDGQTLELLLATEVTAKEFVLSKLGGVLWNTKEAVLVPILFVIMFLAWGVTGGEGAILLTISFLVLIVFSATLGLHYGMGFGNSRKAISNSLGTMFLLFVGVFICMLLIVEARSSFALQLPSFLLFILGGSIALWVSLSHKNPSSALTLAAALLPFLTFYAITAFLLGGSLDVCLALCFAYGFTILAMLVPAISEYTITLGGGSIR